MLASAQLAGEPLRARVTAGLAELARCRASSAGADAEDEERALVMLAMELGPLLTRAVPWTTTHTAKNLVGAMALTAAPWTLLGPQAPALPPSWEEAALLREARALVRAFRDLDWDGMRDDAFVRAGLDWQRAHPQRSAPARALAQAFGSGHPHDDADADHADR